ALQPSLRTAATPPAPRWSTTMTHRARVARAMRSTRRAAVPLRRRCASHRRVEVELAARRGEESLARCIIGEGGRAKPFARGVGVAAFEIVRCEIERLIDRAGDTRTIFQPPVALLVTATATAWTGRQPRRRAHAAGSPHALAFAHVRFDPPPATLP